MSSELEVRMDYPMAEDMCNAFNQAATTLSEIQDVIRQLSAQLRDDVLVGDAGEAICHVLDKDLCRVVNMTQLKMTELSGDVSAVIRLLRDGDTTAASRFM